MFASCIVVQIQYPISACSSAQRIHIVILGINQNMHGLMLNISNIHLENSQLSLRFSAIKQLDIAEKQVQ
jgi:hypothetical protein